MQVDENIQESLPMSGTAAKLLQKRRLKVEQIGHAEKKVKTLRMEISGIDMELQKCETKRGRPPKNQAAPAPPVVNVPEVAILPIPPPAAQQHQHHQIDSMDPAFMMQQFHLITQQITNMSDRMEQYQVIKYFFYYL